MSKDPIIQEIRETRENHAAQFDYDLQKIYKDIKKKEAESDRHYVNFAPCEPNKVITKSPSK